MKEISINQEVLNKILEQGKLGNHLSLDDVLCLVREDDQRKKEEATRKWVEHIEEECKPLRAKNKYNLVPKDIIGAKILNQAAFEKHAFFNESLNKWEILIYCEDEEDDDYDDTCYIFFEDGVCTGMRCVCDGMMSYSWSVFFDSKEIDRDTELKLQSELLDLYNDLIDSGAVDFKDKEETEC